MIRSSIPKILGFFSIVISGIAWILPYISNEIGIVFHWVGAPVLLGSAMLSYFTAVSQRKKVAKINLLLGIVGGSLFIFSSVLGIIYASGYFYLDDGVELFLSLWSYFPYLSEDQINLLILIQSIILMRNPTGERVYLAFFVNSIIGLVLASVSFLFILLVTYYIVTDKVELKEKKPTPKKIKKETKPIRLRNCPRCKAPINKVILEELTKGNIAECEYCKSPLHPSELY